MIGTAEAASHVLWLANQGWERNDERFLYLGSGCSKRAWLDTETMTVYKVGYGLDCEVHKAHDYESLWYYSNITDTFWRVAACELHKVDGQTVEAQEYAENVADEPWADSRFGEHWYYTNERDEVEHFFHMFDLHEHNFAIAQEPDGTEVCVIFDLGAL